MLLFLTPPRCGGATRRVVSAGKESPRAQAAPPIAQRLALPVAGAAAALTFLILQVLQRITGDGGTDFRAVLRGASDLASGRDLYAPALRFLGGGHLRDILSMPTTPYVYPPLLAAVMRPFTAIPPAVALAVWDAVNAGVLAVLFVLIVRVSAARSLGQLVLVGLLYGFYPLDMSLGTGQIDALITLLALVSFLLYRAERPRWAGIVLAFIALIKPTVGALILFYCCRRAWPVVAAFAATIGAGIAASAAVAGGRVLWEYREVAAGWANAFGVLPLNQSLHGLVARLLSPAVDRPPVGVAGDVSLALEALLLLAAGALTVCLLRSGEPAGIRLGTLQYYAAFSVLLLGIPFTENTHLTWLLPGMGLLLVLAAQQGGRHVWRTALIVAYGGLALPVAEKVVWHAGGGLLGRLSSGSECYGLAILTACLAYAAFVPSAHQLEAGVRRLYAVQRRSTNGEPGRRSMMAAGRNSSPSSSVMG